MAVAGLESTGMRRAVVRSEKFMEWQRELSSSRAIYGGRKRHEEVDNMESNVMKKFTLKNDEEDDKIPNEECSDDREVDGEERTADSNLGDANGATPRTKLKKQQHQKQRSEIKKNRKEHEVDQTKMLCSQNDEKYSTPADGEGGRIRRCKQPQKTSQDNQIKRQSQSSPEEDNVQTSQQEQDSNLNQPIRRRQRRTLARSYTPPKEEKDMERVLRSLTRNRGSETPPPPPAVPVPPGKGTKRSKRVAQRLANEEPPPPPLKLPKLQVVLSKKEIHDDWMKITGHRYAGKPKKSTMTARGLNLCTALTCPSTIRYLNEPQ
ncbi:hypothetical protein MPTK1_7g16170 [Marchantia polymorpha subsp. ruderalis]|nr:hypothetical protein MARPO_0111s0003 [Marchantia polymorpha]BBN17671.1 hypothetical protein Mp_7g16170 [Marchantia polymorpha subsp. ruderalis]PTQ31429.1 hypothetical protein MARPO_0111s0003 [Marchantia polymorpha]PTQ31430.1 hypothetical protein MARPO_0111s0003 [Marchantia polymorpha]PTQ31436.1 hypothetical protein MARPO_0111s0003 [Marchantia polymorpha]|eukprot:PTQ31428.1 hypothetical protein MARPO_0111s0003 [Marchantia polymorpha]